MAEHLQALLARVEKLLALATSSNVHEAAAAAARAQALIAAHRLEGLLAAKQADDEEIGEEPIERARRPRAWRGVLASGLAEQSGCLVYGAQVGAETELRVVGRDEDRAMVLALFRWLAPRLEWLSATHGPGRDRAWHDAFRVGAAEQVLERLRALAEPEETALQLDFSRRSSAVAAWAERHLRLGRGRGMRLHADGYGKGRGAAGEVVLPERR